MSDLSAVLLDFRAHSSSNCNFTYDHQRKRSRSCCSSIIPLDALGPNRPMELSEFSFVGDGRAYYLLDSIMFCLTKLTTLQLDFVYRVNAKTHLVDLDRILNTFIHLKTLSIEGWMHDYVVLERGTKSWNSSQELSEKKQLCLESFTFDPKLLCRKGQNALTFLERMGNLKKIQIKSLMTLMTAIKRLNLGHLVEP
ncbi:hypothetical protein FBU30_008372 [Linnemannia zychae]|nr:hypothetical protein FBU30_008372 [Linnemannia zychae]